MAIQKDLSLFERGDIIIEGRHVTEVLNVQGGVVLVKIHPSTRATGIINGEYGEGALARWITDPDDAMWLHPKRARRDRR